MPRAKGRPSDSLRFQLGFPAGIPPAPVVWFWRTTRSIVSPMPIGREILRHSAFNRGILPAVLFLSLMTGFFLLWDSYSITGPSILPSFPLPALRPPTGAVPETRPASAADLIPFPKGGAWETFGTSQFIDPDGGPQGTPALRLNNPQGKGSSLKTTLRNFKSYPWLRIRTEMKTEGVVKGKNGWNLARVVVLFRDTLGKPHYEYAHATCTTTGTNEWFPCVGTFIVPEFAATADVYIQNLGTAGNLIVNGVVLCPAQRSAWVPFWRIVFGLAWIALLAWTVFLLRPWTWRFGLPLLLVVAAILLGVSLPAHTLSHATEEGVVLFESMVGNHHSNPNASPAVPSTSASTPALTPVKPSPLRPALLLWIRKSGHVTLFGLLGLLAVLAFPRKTAPVPASPQLPRGALGLLGVLGLVVFAAATEILQFIFESRTPGIYDWLLDLAGIGGGLAAGVLFLLALPFVVRFKHR